MCGVFFPASVVGFKNELDKPFYETKQEAKKTMEHSPMIKPAHTAAKFRVSFFEGFKLFGAVVVLGHIINARW